MKLLLLIITTLTLLSCEEKEKTYGIIESEEWELINIHSKQIKK